MSEAGKASGRYQLIDALRGLSIILMMAYHLGFTLLMFGMLPENVLFNPLLRVLQPVFAGVFILLCGISSRFSKNNLKRGAITLACGSLITAVTWYMGIPVWFGILQFLGCCMVLYGLFGRFAERIPPRTSLILWTLLFAVCFAVFPLDGISDELAWLGISSDAFRGSTIDYFPLGEWIFLFLAGTVLGKPIREQRFPEWFYTFKIPFFPFVGRHTLILYMAHQPVFYGILTLITSYGRR